MDERDDISEEFPYSFQPLCCSDCGREHGQFFEDTDDKGSLVLCIDCLLERRAQWENDLRQEKADQEARADYFNPDIYVPEDDEPF